MEKTSLQRSLLRYKKGRKETRNKPQAEQYDRLLPIAYNMVETIKLDPDEVATDLPSLETVRKLLAIQGVKEELVPYEQFVEEQAAAHPEVNKTSLLGSRICRRCGRHLSAVESVTRGLGPICVNKKVRG